MLSAPSCGFVPEQAEEDAVLECSFSYWGVPEYHPQDKNLIQQAAGLVEDMVLSSDGLVVTKSVKHWYKGGPSVLASLLEPGARWPGYGIKHYDTLEAAAAAPSNSWQEMASGCDDTLESIGNYIMAYNETSIYHGYWGKDISVPVTGSNNQQTVPRGVDGLQDHNPYSDTVFEFSYQLKRPVALDFTHALEYQEVHLNRFTLPRTELSGEGEANIPGIHVLSAELGVGQLPWSNETVAGIMDVSPYEGFPSFVSMPHYYDGAAELQEYATLIPAPEATDQEYFSYVDIEPASGTTFQGALRLQVSSLINKTADGGIMTDIFYPDAEPLVLTALYWIDQTATISNHDLSIFKEAETLDEAARWTLWLGPAICGVVAIACGVLALRERGYLGCSWCQSGSHVPLEEQPDLENRRSSLLQGEHTKSTGYPGGGTWSERCSLAGEYAKSCTERISGCARTSPGGSSHDVIG
eukprot:TRINITY_DN13441_c0_g3_i3.p1 TRINITY_DN13441_c0_g3~~TRINITY_DN13441_c0_g3_i3.p1  ORF type:complete len:468 (+),score=100.12 TRINITY_DN13441_c0_g3_i3:99-1502(+)